MAAYLSADWFADLQARLDAAGPWTQADSDANLTIQQRVTGTPAGDVAYSVVVAEGRIAVQPGEAAAADVSITQDHETAEAIRAGELTSVNAFMSGRIRATGNMGKLLEHQAILLHLSEAIGRTEGEAV